MSPAIETQGVILCVEVSGSLGSLSLSIWKWLRFRLQNIVNQILENPIFQPPILWAIFCCSVLLIPIYATMYFCRWKILSMLEQATFVKSPQTRLNIKRFVKVGKFFLFVNFATVVYSLVIAILSKSVLLD